MSVYSHEQSFELLNFNLALQMFDPDLCVASHSEPFFIINMAISVFLKSFNKGLDNNI